jgi:hypothetical protein
VTVLKYEKLLNTRTTKEEYQRFKLFAKSQGQSTSEILRAFVQRVTKIKKKKTVKH